MEANSEEGGALRRRREIVENAEDNMEQSRLDENEESTPTDLPSEIEEPMDFEFETSSEEDLEPEEQESWKYFSIKWSIYILIWLTLYIYFLEVRFDSVFLMFSFLIGIYLSTRTRPRRKGEWSAYSVFNENCVSLNGALKAELFEQEIIFGAGAMRMWPH